MKGKSQESRIRSRNIRMASVEEMMDQGMAPFDEGPIFKWARDVPVRYEELDNQADDIHARLQK